MGSINKGISLLLVAILAVSSLMMFESASAQSIPKKPSAPEFTSKIVESSFNVITTDPYTGVNTTQQVTNDTIEFRIINQPFNTIYDAKNNINTSLYYNIQVKGHYAQSWMELFHSINYSYPLSNNEYSWYNYPIQSNSEYTIISLPQSYSVGDKVDFQVQAIIANQTEIYIPNFIPNPIRGGDYTPETVMFIIQTSDWSNTQTVTIPDGSVSTSTSASPNPTPTPTVPEFPLLVILPLFLCMFLIATKLLRRKCS